MEMALKLASIFFTMILVDNYVLAKFLGICPVSYTHLSIFLTAFWL